jgi:hypothetical protein
MIKTLYFLILSLIISAPVAFSQQISAKPDSVSLMFHKDTAKQVNVFDIHFNGYAFLDDHEYDALVPLRKTISGTRTEIDLGYHVDSLNQFVVGVNPLHEFGGVPFFVQVVPIAYYQFQNKHWLFQGGEFPRLDNLNFPRALLNVDSISYYRPQIEGLLLRTDNKYGHETGFIDWISRQTPTNRNQFMAGELGFFRPFPGHAFYITHFFLFEHNAGSKSDTAASIQDSGGGQIRLGLDYSHKTIFDSLKLESGYMITAHRTRAYYNFLFSKGIVESVYIGKGRLAIFDEFWKGNPSDLTFADPFYTKSIYNRLDLLYTPFKGKHLHGTFFLSLHQSPSHLNDSEPGVKIVYDIGRKTLAKFKDDN